MKILLLLLLQDGDLAQKCGSEVRWEAAWEAAAARAAKERKPVFWYVTTVPGTKMDRKDVVDKYMMAGPFMSPEVVALLNERFVPLRMSARREDAKSYGVKVLDFIEPGILFLTAEGKLLHRMDRLYTYNEEWFVDQMCLVLGENPCEKRLKTEKDPLERARLWRILRKPKEALAELEKAQGAGLQRGILALKQHRYAEAAELLRDLDEPQAQYLYGCALHLTLRDKEAVDVWKKVEGTESRWAWKAAAELRRDGPFSRAFEEVGWLPEDAYGKKMATTDLPRREKDVDAMVRRGVEFLLKHQKSSGAWNDSNYDFAGKDSLPDVYVAGTALAALALLMWRDVDSERIDAALARADKYLSDESNIATTNEQERAWAHLYRLIYMAARGKHPEKMKEIAATLRKMQKESGIWYHEYPNPFVSASVLHALDAAKKAGVETDDAVLKRGARAVASCKDADATYSYGYPKRRSPIQSSAGRMPICEYALFLHGMSKAEEVRKAIDFAFEYHPLREKVRKYDDHADAWANGGFFFYYDLFGISLAADALPKGERAKVHDRLKDIVLSIGEIDGSWQDSHELGKSYGTSIALILLKRAK